MKLVLLQAAYFPGHSSSLKGRCKRYQGSDTVTSPPRHQGKLRENNPQNLYHWKQQCQQPSLWKLERLKHGGEKRLLPQLTLALRWKEGVQHGFSRTLHDSKCSARADAHQTNAGFSRLRILSSTKTFQSTACGFLQLSHRLASLLLPPPVSATTAWGTQDPSDGTGHFFESLGLKDLPGNLSVGVRRKPSLLLDFTASILQLRGRQVCSVGSCTPGTEENQKWHLVWWDTLLGPFFWWAFRETQFSKPATNNKTRSCGCAVSCNRIPPKPRRASPPKVWLECTTSVLPYSSPTAQASNVNDSARFITVACTFSITIRDEEGLGSGTAPD